MNDGAVNARGPFWLNSTIDDYYSPQKFTGGRLFRINPDGCAEDMGLDLKLPNGIGWSPDDSKMHLNDTVALATYVFDFDSESGRLSGQSVLNGMVARTACPTECLLTPTATFGSLNGRAGASSIFRPRAALLQTVSTPVRRPSSVALCGEALGVLMFTSATFDLKNSDYLESPDAGGLFRLIPGVSGRRENLFGLCHSVI